MANSATLTPNLQFSPSIFEISAAEFLDQLLYPALSKLFDFFGLNYKLKCRNLDYCDDFSPIFVAALQLFYLKKQGSSLGECIYGLQRIPLKNPPQLHNDITINLTKRQQISSAVFLVFLPILERKLKERESQHESTKTEKICLTGIKLLNCTKTIYMLCYLAKVTQIHSPIMKLIGLKLQYKPPNENQTTTQFILKFIEIFAFFLQFLQWWYNSDNNTRTKNFGKLKNPKKLIKVDKNTFVKNTPGLCPICYQKLRIPTASSISGYTYCFKCIMNHLRTEKKCPCTGYPMDINDLIRIYDDE